MKFLIKKLNGTGVEVEPKDPADEQSLLNYKFVATGLQFTDINDKPRNFNGANIDEIELLD